MPPLPDRPHASISAGPPLTTSVLPSMLAGIGLTCTPAFEAEVRSRAASNVSDPVEWGAAPQLPGPEPPFGNEAGIRTGNPDWVCAPAASERSCGLGGS